MKSGGRIRLILNVGIKWRWTASLRPRSLYPRGNNLQYPPNMGLGGPQIPFRHFGVKRNLLILPRSEPRIVHRVSLSMRLFSPGSLDRHQVHHFRSLFSDVVSCSNYTAPKVITNERIISKEGQRGRAENRRQNPQSWRINLVHRTHYQEQSFVNQTRGLLLNCIWEPNDMGLSDISSLEPNILWYETYLL